MSRHARDVIVISDSDSEAEEERAPPPRRRRVEPAQPQPQPQPQPQRRGTPERRHVYSLDDILAMRRRDAAQREAEARREAAMADILAEENAQREARREREHQEDLRVRESGERLLAGLRALNIAAQAPRVQGLLRGKRALAEYHRRRM